MKQTAVAAEYESAPAPVVAQTPGKAVEPDRITISCYENDVPSFVEADLDRLYGNIYSSLVQFRLYSDGRDTSTYIVRKGGETVTVFLFQHENSNVRVINEGIRIEEEDAARFARYIFATFASATVILFKAINTNIRKLPFPHQRFNHLEDIVLTLPDSADEYLARLGKNTRRNIKRYGKRLKETFPSLDYRVRVADEVDDKTVQDIVNLNRARMAVKNKVSAIDRQETQRIASLTKACGLVGVITVDGRICAGAISYRAGSNYFLSVIAHDPRYDEYWIGILCCYFTICECIARGGKEFHFLWGEYEYKYTLLGEKRALDNVAVYRSGRHVLTNGGMVLRNVCKGYARQARLWLHGAKHRDTLVSRLALMSISRFRKLKRQK